MTTVDVKVAPALDPRSPDVRLGQLLDSLSPLHAPDDSGVTAVRGMIDGREVIAYCTDATKMGGALGSEGSTHIVNAIDTAIGERCPVIGLWHSGGAKLADGVESMDAVGQMFAAMTRASGRVPQISVVLGPAAGAGAYGPALTDLVIMAPAGKLFVTGPDVVRTVTGEQIDMDGLGGSEAHSRKSGVVHVTASSEDDAYARARRITGLFARPGDFSDMPDSTDLRALLPDTSRQEYDVHPLIHQFMDAATFEEMQPHWAANIVVGLGRLGGRTVGVVANNPSHKGGSLDSLAADKASRFVRMADSFGIPLVVIVDAPGYLPAVSEEWGGVERRGAKLLHAFVEATVPSVTVITRKSYGDAYIAMNSRSLGATAVFAWPDAEVAAMDAEATVRILHHEKLADTPEAEQPALVAQLIVEHEQTAGGVSRAVELGLVDEVVDPSSTRRRVVETLAAAPAIRGDHRNIPL